MMGNYKFRLSDMIPNAWFYKLKDMGGGRGRNHTSKKQDMMISSSSSSSTTKPSKVKPPPHHFYPRKSYYITRELIPSDKFYASPPATNTKSLADDPPTKSSKQRSRKRRTRTRSSPKLVSSGCNCRATLWIKASEDDDTASSDQLKLCDEPNYQQEFRSDCNILTTHQTFDNMVSRSRSCNCKLNPDQVFVKKFDKLEISELQLPPIITKPVKFNDMVKDIKKKESTSKPVKKGHGSVRKISVNPPGFKLRVNSPKIGSRRLIQGQTRKSVSSSSSSLSDSFAVVKSSFDPQRDFGESMVEMIMENNIRASKDLEDLLACYLSLNSDQYHHLIINVFKQIWFDLSDARFK